MNSVSENIFTIKLSYVQPPLLQVSLWCLKFGPAVVAASTLWEIYGMLWLWCQPDSGSMGCCGCGVGTMGLIYGSHRPQLVTLRNRNFTQRVSGVGIVELRARVEHNNTAHRRCRGPMQTSCLGARSKTSYASEHLTHVPSRRE